MTMLFSCTGPCNTVAACAVFPQTPKQGDVWFDTNTSEWKTWNGSAWIVVAGGGGGGAGGAPGIIVNPADPGAATQPNGAAWFNPTTGELKVANGGAWVDLVATQTQADETYQYEALPAAANIGAAWTAAGVNVTEDTVLATWGTPSSVYLLVDNTTPGAAASWRKVGDVRDFATAAELVTGTEANKVISPATLRALALNAPTGAGGTADPADADHLVRLNANGRIDDAFLQVDVMIYKGPVDVTATAPTGWQAGDFGHVDTAGTVDASFGGIGGQIATAGDLLTFDGTNFHLIPQVSDITAAIPAFASQAEVHTGTATNRIVNPATLRGETLNAPSTGTAAAADADKLPRLDANGLVDDGFIPKATGPQVITGTAGDLFLTPAALRAATAVAPGGAGGAPAAADANKLVRLDATGAIDADLLDVDIPVEATDAQVGTGTDAAAFVSSRRLRAATLDAPSTGAIAAADANKIPRLGAGGALENTFVEAGRFWEIWIGTQAAYDALAATAAPPGPGYDANTLYAITGP